VQTDRGDRADVVPVAEGIGRASTESGQAFEVPGEGECPVEEADSGSVFGQPDPEGSLLGKPLARQRGDAQRCGGERDGNLSESPNVGPAKCWDRLDRLKRRERHIPEDETGHSGDGGHRRDSGEVFSPAHVDRHLQHLLACAPPLPLL